MIPSPDTIVILAALAADACFGEPPNALHPVAWIGRTISGALRVAPSRDRLAQLAFGAALALGIPSAAAALTALALGAVGDPFARVALATLALKATFALRALGEAGVAVATALERGGPEAARPLLRALCSRDPAALDERQLAAASVESLAENLSDSVVAPLFYFALFGVPGAVFYRAVNTLDAMIGYRGRYEYLGKAAARLDDLLNLVPARLTALLLLGAGALLRLPVGRGLAALRRDGAKTESPNAGRPMAAAAGLLGVRLDKPGHYVLFAEGGPASSATIRAARRLVSVAAYAGGALAVVAIEGTRG